MLPPSHEGPPVPENNNENRELFPFESRIEISKRIFQTMERLNTEGGLRELTRTRAEDVIAYMQMPLFYKDGDLFPVSNLLDPNLPEPFSIDPPTFWAMLTPKHERIVIDELGTLLGANILAVRDLMEGIYKNHRKGFRSTTRIHTPTQMIDVEIIYDEEGKFQYNLVKNEDLLSQIGLPDE